MSTTRNLVAMVTGAAGGLGSHLAAALAHAGYRVAAVDRIAVGAPDGGVSLTADLALPGGAADAV